MRGKRIAKIAFIAVPLVGLALVLFTFLVMGLWNWLTPALFGWKLITFWQAAALLILSKILFGGFRGGHGGSGHWRRRMGERWEQMTPEERETFRKGIQSRFDHFEPPAQNPKTREPKVTAAGGRLAPKGQTLGTTEDPPLHRQK
jgi:hypothetical protein